ncbi:hypothetical protein [Cyanobacterium stanieri]|nr:hypothetical protein [Cyanobacterium stanieri]
MKEESPEFIRGECQSDMLNSESAQRFCSFLEIYEFKGIFSFPFA